MVDMELPPQENLSYLSAKQNFENREDHINWFVEIMKQKYCKIIENNEWEIYLVVESGFKED